MSEKNSSKEKITRIFNLVSQGYDHPSLRFFPFCADFMVTYLRPRPGSKILDIGTGTGAVAVVAGQAVGPGGRIMAIDLAEEMMDKAVQNVNKMALNNVDFHAMDAEDLEFRSSYFDYVISSFGIFFLEDMVKGLRDWMRVLKPGGKVMFSVFGKNAFQPMANLFRERIAHYGVVIDAPAWQRLAEIRDCEALLQAAGAEEVEVFEKQFGFHLNDEKDWWAVLWNSGYRGFLEQIPTDQRDKFQQEHLKEVASLATDKGIWMDVGTNIAIGRRPDKQTGDKCE